ncbi:GntR family transcriptional regulator [Clostridium neuense]|uniref:GntR family transcriptional regulator n=1 Tax=Clostridium neuense TaxID=1728934 RepID=A0ABW8TDJ1_9CLOT
MGRYMGLVSIEISDRIEEYIDINNLKEHDKLPSERELAEIWKVNRTTLRRAIDKLINEGVLYSKDGRENYVSPKKIDRDLCHFMSFTETMKNRGLCISTKLVSIKIVEANKELAKALSIFLGREVLEIKRIRIVDEKPLDFEISYIPSNLCKGIEKYDLENNSLYKILERDFKIKLLKQRQDVSMQYVGLEEGKYLDIKEGTAVLVSKGITLNVAEEPVEYSIAFTRADRCSFSSVLK